MRRRIPIMLALVPLLYACASESGQEQEQISQAVEIDSAMEFSDWLDSTRAMKFAPDRQPRPIQRPLLKPSGPETAAPGSGREFRVTHRGQGVSVAGKNFPPSRETGRFQADEEPELWEVADRPGMVYFEVGNRTVGVRWADSTGQELAEGNLVRIHVDAVGGERIVIAYYDKVGSEEALDSNTVQCTRCPPRRVCSVTPDCQ